MIRELDRQEGMQGQDVGLTIDAELQKSVLTRLGEESASAVVMDCRNGEVLAMATNPRFDPSLFNSGVSPGAMGGMDQQPARAADQQGGRRRCMRRARPSRWWWRWPGWRRRPSRPATASPAPATSTSATRRFHCWRKGGHGTLDMRGALKNSCDVYFYEVARRTGIDRIAAMANRFGLGVDLDIELPGARTGLVPTRAWRMAQGQALEHRRHHRARHRPGLHPAHAAAARDLCRRGWRPAARCSRISPAASAACCSRARGRRTGRALGLPERDAARGARRDVGGGERARRHRAVRQRWPIPAVQMAGKTGSVQVRRVSPRAAGARLQVGEPALGIPAARAVRRLRALRRAALCAWRVVVEHGNAGAAAAAPIARDIMTDVLTRDPAEPQRSRRPARGRGGSRGMMRTASNAALIRDRADSA